MVYTWRNYVDMAVDNYNFSIWEIHDNSRLCLLLGNKWSGGQWIRRGVGWAKRERGEFKLADWDWMGDVHIIFGARESCGSLLSYSHCVAQVT